MGVLVGHGANGPRRRVGTFGRGRGFHDPIEHIRIWPTIRVAIPILLVGTSSPQENGSALPASGGHDEVLQDIYDRPLEVIDRKIREYWR
jgi:hypothetical protein